MVTVMTKYVGTKFVDAEPMTREAAEKFLERSVGGDRHGDGYLVRYEDGYMSWSPKDVFEKAYSKTEGMTFGMALDAMKAGGHVARTGWWGGNDMYIAMKPGYPDGVPCNEATSKTHGIEAGTKIVYCPYLEIRSVDGSFVPWLASQTDMLATDWVVL